MKWESKRSNEDGYQVRGEVNLDCMWLNTLTVLPRKNRLAWRSNRSADEPNGGLLDASGFVRSWGE